MHRKNNKILGLGRLIFLWSMSIMTTAFAGAPLWTFEPLTATTLSVPANGTASVQYRVTNQSSQPHTLTMQAIPGIAQITTGLNVCNHPFVLRSKNSCILSLEINGSQLNGSVMDGPTVCQQGSTLQCYRPNKTNILRIKQAPPIVEAEISVIGSPLTLTANGATGQLTINNLSTQLFATNITSNFTGTALDGNVTETGNTCANVPPGGNCILTYTPGNTVVAQTDFTIQGSNTNALTAAIQIQSGSTLSGISPVLGSASCGAGFTLTGTGLTGATAVSFGGTAATSINVVNSTTVTGVTPAHVVGVVDVVINTPAGGATLANGFTYVATSVGQAAYGGTVACLNGGLNNLIAATADNSAAIEWGGLNTAIGASVQSNTDGATNTQNIVAALGNNGGTPYAAQLCSDYNVDSQGNSPCQAGNTCYNDWFLPAGNNSTVSGQLYCLYTNRVAIGGFNTLQNYWSSTETTAFPAFDSFIVSLFDGSSASTGKNGNLPVRCVRAFTP